MTPQSVTYCNKAGSADRDLARENIWARPSGHCAGFAAWDGKPVGLFHVDSMLGLRVLARLIREVMNRTRKL